MAYHGMKTTALTIWPLLLLAAAPLCAAVHYIDPEHGSDTNDGSALRPWKSLQHVMDSGLVETTSPESLPFTEDTGLVARNEGAPVKPGDVILLRSGDHGSLAIRGMFNADYVTIAADEGHTPVFRSVTLQSGSHWAFKDVHIQGERDSDDQPRTLMSIRSHSWHGPVHDVVVEGCVLSSTSDASRWSAEDWNRRARNGIHADGTRIILRGNYLKNVNFGLSVSASHSLVESNTVENFSGDGIRGLGDHSVFQYNLIKNCYDVNDNHDDGFQSWSLGPDGRSGGGVVRGIVLRGNTIINFEDPNQPHRGPLQGIGCFDGMFEDWIIENNVVMVDHWHGITLLGATGCLIVNNTVIDLSPGKPGPTWIRIDNHKNGTASSDCVIRNNIATDIRAADGVVMDHNLIAQNPDAVFADAAGHDVSLAPDSPAIDAGSGDRAPECDITGAPRPQGSAVDLGAYEFSDVR